MDVMGWQGNGSFGLWGRGYRLAMPGTMRPLSTVGFHHYTACDYCGLSGGPGHPAWLAGVSLSNPVLFKVMPQNPWTAALTDRLEEARTKRKMMLVSVPRFTK